MREDADRCPNALGAKFNQAGPDLRITTARKEFVGDITVRNVHAAAYAGQGPEQAFAELSATKQREYGDICAGIELVTLAALSHGHMAPPLVELLSAAAQASDRDAATLIDRMATVIALQSGAIRLGAEKAAGFAPPTASIWHATEARETMASTAAWLLASLEEKDAAVSRSATPDPDLAR